ncbi:MAG: class I SAM-dependent methyltransferase [Isosphaeraceae bacterium]
MSETQAMSYDEIPYESRAHVEAHPDRLATLATLFGMRPPSLDRARVLEIGCAGGGNLIPMALAMPEARFTGIDLSTRQIADARGVADQLTLTNLTLQARSVADPADDLGEFDYILCHGVFSWVPPDVQEAILELCRRQLASNGVAFISYNTLPGWHQRGLIRELMTFYTRTISDPIAKAKRAREVVDLVAAAAPERDGSHARALVREAERLRGQSDSYLIHEHLETDNNPLYVHDFVERADAHGLQYLTDARFQTMPDNQPAETLQVLDSLAGDDPLGREQALDFLCNRAFRRSLLCHADVPLTHPPTPDSLASLRVSTLIGPASTSIDLFSDAVEQFRGIQVPASLSTNNPLIKSALMVLFEHWPRSLPFEELRMRTYTLLARAPGPNPPPIDRDPGSLGAALLQGVAAGCVDLHAFEPEFNTQISEQPTASPWARTEAETSPRVTNLRHQIIELSGFDRLVLRQLDGRRDWYALLDALDEAVTSGEFPIHQDGQAITDNLKIRQILGKSLDPSLKRLASSCLLVT